MADFLSQDELDMLLDVTDEDAVPRTPAQWKYREREGKDVTNKALSDYWYDRYLERDKEVYTLREQIAAYRQILAQELRN